MFRDRVDAGQQLAAAVKSQVRPLPDLVLGIPRGGVPVAAEIAAALGVPLDVLVVRKLGHPDNPEYAIGAIAGGGILILHRQAGVAERAVQRAHRVAVAARRAGVHRGDLGFEGPHRRRVGAHRVARHAAAALAGDVRGVRERELAVARGVGARAAGLGVAVSARALRGRGVAALAHGLGGQREVARPRPVGGRVDHARVALQARGARAQVGAVREANAVGAHGRGLGAVTAREGEQQERRRGPHRRPPPRSKAQLAWAIARTSAVAMGDRTPSIDAPARHPPPRGTSTLPRV